MKVTVILCTRNRCRSLAKTLESLASLRLPQSVAWEILVVDNNSKDETYDVVRLFCRRYPGRFRYLHEPRDGKSNALNAGIREAQSDVLAFTDDDVALEPTWLSNLTASLGDGEWAGAGGRTLPERSFSAPKWLPQEGRHALAPLAIFDRGIAPGELTEAPYGNNMAYRKTVFEKYGGFRNDLGPRPGCKGPQKGEDSEFGNRVRAAGERLRYEPSAVLYHSTPENRVSKEYFLAWWFDKARTDIRTLGIPGDAKWSVAGIPLSLVPRLVAWSLRWMCSLRPVWRFSCKVNVWTILGEIKECHLLWCENRAKIVKIRQRTHDHSTRRPRTRNDC